MFADWRKHRQEIRELREINSWDFARIAQELSVTPDEFNRFVRRGPHASDELRRAPLRRAG